jgi:hypothetical protein
MGIGKGRWVDGRYIDGNGNELIPPKGMFNGVKKKDINEPVVSVGEIIEDVEKKKKHYNKNFKDLFIIWRKKVFTVPVLTMIGVWIIVYYQVTSSVNR